MLLNTQTVATLQAQDMANRYKSRAWVAMTREGRYLVTISPQALAGTNPLSSYDPT